MTAISEALSDERKHSPELVAALLNLKTKLEALPEPLRGPFVFEGLKPYLRSGNGGEVRVKALEWSGIIPGRMFADIYMIERLYLDDWRLMLRANEQGDWPKFIAGPFTLAEAKAAAQADYETRIRSTLSTPPVGAETGEPVAYLHKPTGNVFTAKDHAILLPKWQRQFAADMTADEIAADFVPLVRTSPAVPNTVGEDKL